MTYETTRFLRRSVIFLMFIVTVAAALLAYAMTKRVDYPYDRFLPEKKDRSAVISKNFIGEELNYVAGSHLTGVLATARLSFKEAGEGLFEAHLDFSTAGIASHFLPKRVDTYVETMEVTEDGKSLRTKKLEKLTDTGTKVKRDVVFFDHASRIMKWEKWRKGEKGDEESVDMRNGVVYEGPFTGFYNFRFQNHGSIEDGKTYMIRTFPKTRNKEVDLYLASVKDSEGLGKHKVYPMDVKFDIEPSNYGDNEFKKHHYGMKFGDIKVTLTEDLVPVEVEFMNLTDFTKPKVTLTSGPAAGKKAPR